MTANRACKDRLEILGNARSLADGPLVVVAFKKLTTVELERFFGIRGARALGQRAQPQVVDRRARRPTNDRFVAEQQLRAVQSRASQAGANRGECGVEAAPGALRVGLGPKNLGQLLARDIPAFARDQKCGQRPRFLGRRMGHGAAVNAKFEPSQRHEAGRCHSDRFCPGAAYSSRPCDSARLSSRGAYPGRPSRSLGRTRRGQRSRPESSALHTWFACRAVHVSPLRVSSTRQTICPSQSRENLRISVSSGPSFIMAFTSPAMCGQRTARQTGPPPLSRLPACPTFESFPRSYAV